MGPEPKKNSLFGIVLFSILIGVSLLEIPLINYGLQLKQKYESVLTPEYFDMKVEKDIYKIPFFK